MPLRPLRTLCCAALLVIAGCGESTEIALEESRQQLVGTWLSDSEDRGIRTRTVLALDRNGTFREDEKLTDAKGLAREASYLGEWLFDGVSLKRKYTQIDGRPLPALQAASTSYAINLQGGGAFFGVDAIKKRAIRFVRTDTGARP